MSWADDIPDSDLHPTGWTEGQIQAITGSILRDNDGTMLKIQFAPKTGGGHVFQLVGWTDDTGRDGRKTWVRNGRRMIKQVCTALGLDPAVLGDEPDALNERAWAPLLNRPLEANIGLEPAKDGWDAKNTIGKFRQVGAGAFERPAPAASAPPMPGPTPWGATPATPPASGPPAQQPAPAGTGFVPLVNPHDDAGIPF